MEAVKLSISWRRVCLSVGSTSCVCLTQTIYSHTVWHKSDIMDFQLCEQRGSTTRCFSPFLSGPVGRAVQCWLWCMIQVCQIWLGSVASFPRLGHVAIITISFCYFLSMPPKHKVIPLYRIHTLAHTRHQYWVIGRRRRQVTTRRGDDDEDDGDDNKDDDDKDDEDDAMRAATSTRCGRRQVCYMFMFCLSAEPIVKLVNIDQTLFPRPLSKTSLLVYVALQEL